jgi:RES domain-containing protein
MPVAWRVVKRRLADDAFDGEGAFQHGGRWNSPGTRVVYAASTTSLAILEVIVHGVEPLLDYYAAIPVEFDAALVTEVDPATLPSGWRAFPAPFELKRIGDEWVASGRSAVLRVPSAVVPHEWNYLLSPEHEDFERVEIGDAVSLETDLRLPE